MMLARSCCVVLVVGATLAGLLACTQTTVVQPTAPAATDAATGDAGARPTSRVEGKSDTLFGSKATSFATVDDETGIVVSVGIVVPVKAFESAPTGAPFQDDLVLEMPKVAQQQTMLNHVRVNWLTSGHSPSPYGEPHFDMHFQRGTLTEVDAIDCRADARMPAANVLPTGYGAPELCVNAMGQHSWPQADKGNAWTGSIIMGYWATKVAFIEPMISKAKLVARKTFTLDIARPTTTGGTHTLYPRRLTATYDETGAAYTFEFDQLEEID
jgi:hypothetical protein